MLNGELESKGEQGSKPTANPSKSPLFKECNAGKLKKRKGVGLAGKSCLNTGVGHGQTC